MLAQDGRWSSGSQDGLPAPCRIKMHLLGVISKPCLQISWFPPASIHDTFISSHYKLETTAQVMYKSTKPDKEEEWAVDPHHRHAPQEHHTNQQGSPPLDSVMYRFNHVTFGSSSVGAQGWGWVVLVTAVIPVTQISGHMQCQPATCLSLQTSNFKNPINTTPGKPHCWWLMGWLAASCLCCK